MAYWQDAHHKEAQRKKEKNALRSKKKWFRWHFPPLQKAKIRGVKGRIKGGKTRNFLIYFAKILIKRAKSLGRAKAFPCVLIALNEGTRIVLPATIKLIINTIQSKPHPSE